MQVNDEDAEIIAAAREGFMEEASDMLRQFEQALLTLENTPDDTEMLNAAFRAAHTIKGTAGLFGFTHVVSFTHGVADSPLQQVGTYVPMNTPGTFEGRSGTQVTFTPSAETFTMVEFDYKTLEHRLREVREPREMGVPAH